MMTTYHDSESNTDDEGIMNVMRIVIFTTVVLPAQNVFTYG